jgi:serine/threonine protein kinase
MMTPDRWRRIEEIFHAALDRAPEDRGPFLDQACGTDTELRAEVESLLAENVSDAILQAPIQRAAESVTRTEDARIGQRFGFYRITGLIGQGGMGAVYRGGRDDDEYRKQVAIKLVKRGMDTDSLLRRFRYERQILASLEHPHIARLLDGGTTDDGLPYLVMEYIGGQPITKYCDAISLTIPERLRLFLKVCEAVGYAHQNLVVHRDLKPGNILVTGDGAPKLLDFGIAKLLTADPESDDTPNTATSVHLMTPDYASPEQVRGGAITTATDIYSLGAVLYELLSGERAHRFQSHAPSEIERVVCDTDAEKPSAAAARTGAPTAKLRKHLAGDLDNIVLMAMRKEPKRRYSSVEQFAEDIRKYLDGRPVIARQDTFGYRSAKFVQRNRVAVASAAVIAVTLVGGIAMTTYQAQRAGRRFDQVRRLANTVLFNLSDQIGALPGSTEARETVARTGLEYLDSLAAEASDDPELQLELAEGYHRLALVQGGFRVPGLEQFDAALASHRKALALGRQLLARSANDIRVLSLMVKTHSNVGDILQERGQSAEASAEMREAMRLLGPLETRTDLTIDQMFDVVVLLHFDGDLQLKLGDRRAAERQYRRALEWDERILTRFPGPRAQHSLSLDLATFGDALAAGGDLSGAMDQYYKALAVRLENVKQNPDNSRYRRELSLLYSWMGHFTGNPNRMNLGDRAKAEEYYRLNLGLAEELAREDPKNVQAQIDLSFANEHLASVVAERDAAAAVAMFRRALAVIQPLLEKSPTELRYLRRRATQQRLLAVALHKSGDPAARLAMREALAQVRSIIAAQPANDTLKPDLYATLMASAPLLFDVKARGEASTQLHEARTLGEEMRKARRDDLDWQWRVANAYSALGRYTGTSSDACDWHRKALAIWEAWPSHAVSSAFDITRRDQAARALADCQPAR